MWTDSHAHLETFEDREEMLGRAFAAGVSTVLAIGIGEGPATMHRALDFAKQARGEGMPRVLASVGIHPQEAASADTAALALLEDLAMEPKCVAVGEIGLDYYHVDNPAMAVQHRAFVAQMEIAVRLRKPILIHCRTSELATAEAKVKFGPADAWEDLLQLIGAHWSSHGLGGVMHCFSGTVAQARRSVEAGFHLSFAGNLTYPRSVGIREAAVWAPGERVLVETDAPFLAPIPHRGQRNEPALMVHTGAALAELRGVEVEEIARLTTANFERLFASTWGLENGLPRRSGGE